jgi:uncharacterized phiE125 gp8 family phage protein
MIAREPIIDLPLLTRTVAPAALMSVADAKAHCRIDTSADDSYVDALIQVATDRLDGPSGITGRALVTQTWTVSVREPGERDRLYIPLTPVQSITSISYYDGNGDVQAATVADFNFVNGRNWAYLEPLAGRSWPSTQDRPDAITVTFVAGFGAAADVPANLVHAARLLVSHYYENREQGVDRRMYDIPEGVHALVSTHKAGWANA